MKKPPCAKSQPHTGRKKTTQIDWKNIPTKDVSNSLLLTNEMTLVVLLPSIRCLLSPPVTTCLDIPGDGWYSLATKELVIKTFLGGIYIIITFTYLVLAKTSVTSYHPVNHVIRVICTNAILLSLLGLEVSRRYESLNQTDFTILFTSIHFSCNHVL